MIKFVLIFLAALAVIHARNLNVQDSVQVQVYYESLCPDSIAFITTQLYPTFATLGSNRVKLELIPYGHASEQDYANGTKAFTCQHGPRECYGNKVHACAINLNKVENSTEFVFCSERSEDPASDVILKECAEIVGISWTDIQECVSSGYGDDLLSEYGEKTDLVDPVFVPTIILDGEYSQENQDQSLVYFKALICDLIGFPDQCKC